jgi:replicative DNA helicase
MLDAAEAEHALLGAVLYDNTALHRIDGLAPSHFHDPVHGRIYAAISDLVGMDRGADPISVGDRMAADAGLADAGGRDYLGGLFQNAPPAANAPEYAAIIVDNATRRSLCDAAATISRLATDDRERDAGEIAIEAEKALTEIARTGVTRDAWCEAETAVLRAYQRARAGGGIPGVPTGLVDLDAVLGGLRPSTVNVLAGRPGMGKSAAGVQIVLNVARRGQGAAFFSLEMPEEQCSVRFGAALAYDRHAIRYSGESSNPTYEQFERGDLSAGQWGSLDRAMEQVQGLPIMLDFRSRLKVSQMTAAVRRQLRAWQRQGVKPGVVVIDHFLHIASEKGARGEAAERYTAIANDLLHMAKSLDIAILLLCQLNRGVEGREDKRPSLADLKWTGALEENAFSATFLYRPEYYVKPPVDHDDEAWDRYEKDKARTANKLFWIVEKNRGGQSNRQVETFCDIGCNALLDREAFQ